MNKVKLVNLNKVEAMIVEAEGRATARKLRLDDVLEALDRVSDRLFIVSTRKDAIGTEVEVDVNHQNFPNAYKYIPESTHFRAVYKSAGWKVEAVWRSRCWGDSTFAVINFTEATRQKMAERLSRMD